MKNKINFKKTLIIFSFVIFVIIICIFISYKIMLMPVSKDSKEIVFKIKKGSTVYSVGKDLKNKKLIKNNLAYKIYIKLNKVNNYNAGYYIIKKDMSIPKIVNALEEKGKSKDLSITFVEGINTYKFADIISKNTNNTKDDVLNILNDKEYINSLIDRFWFLDSNILDNNIYFPLEGYLFPDTYRFESSSINIEAIIEKLLLQTEKVLAGIVLPKDKSVHEILTLASIIEQEGVTSADRKLISSVFYNRLRIKMPLGSDVTTFYAFKVDLSQKELSSKQFNTYNPYNTRGPNMEGKLPVGPICSPSLSSIIAAIEPEESDYYYFVADNTSKVYFAKTLKEHYSIIAKLKEEKKW